MPEKKTSPVILSEIKEEDKRMNTKDNLDNKNLPVNEEQSENLQVNNIPEENVSDSADVEEIFLSEESQIAESQELITEAEDEVVVSEPQQPRITSGSEDNAAENIVNEEKDAAEPVESEDSPIDYDMDFENVEEESEADTEEEDINETTAEPEQGASLFPIDEIVLKLRELNASDAPQRKEIDEYKQQFYRLLRNETEQQKNAFLADGGEEIDFFVNEPPIYVEGKELIQSLKEKRAAILAQQESEKEANVAKKLAIIEKIKQLTENQGQEDFNKSYQEFKALQQQWNDIKLIPQAKANELWKSYQRYVEIFYDLVRINNEFREYDFRKNFEIKTELCEAAERLDEEPDVVSAFHQLQNLHQEWREIGPVSRKDRVEIWERFKEASLTINKKYQAHFEGLKEQEDENLEKKVAICEKLESINYDQLKSIKDWNAQVKEVLEIQKEWREIGYVPRKWNTKIYERYRAACDFFFRTKSNYYKSFRDEMDENLKKKIVLCERAEELKDSQDWRKTTQEMIQLQREWKTIGIIPHKHMDNVWKRFITACDYFFEQKKKHTSSQYDQESKNLEVKKSIVDKIKNLDVSLTATEALPVLRELMDEWHTVGYVPYKVKDKTYREFHEATEAQFDRLNIDKADRQLESFKTNISDMAKSDNAKGQLLRERERLMRQYERMKTELQTYENNIGFLSVSSKKGNSLIDDMNHKVKKIKSELDLIIKKIEAIDEEIR